MVALGEQQVTLGDFAESYQQYEFEFDGPAFAEYIREQMTDYLQKQGDLLAGMTLGTSDEYRQMTGAVVLLHCWRA